MSLRLGGDTGGLRPPHRLPWRFRRRGVACNAPCAPLAISFQGGLCCRIRKRQIDQRMRNIEVKLLLYPVLGSLNHDLQSLICSDRVGEQRLSFRLQHIKLFVAIARVMMKQDQLAGLRLICHLTGHLGRAMAPPLLTGDIVMLVELRIMNNQVGVARKIDQALIGTDIASVSLENTTDFPRHSMR